MRNQLNVRTASRAEVDMLLGWAGEEGWNPGLHDAQAFYDADPDGFLLAEVDGTTVGVGAIVAYNKFMGFMGLFIVRPEYRGHGYGRELWFKRLELLKNRLASGGSIGLDGVEAMQHFYAAGGFRFSHTSVRHVGRIDVTGLDESGIADLSALPFSEVVAFDARHFGCERTAFLRHWIKPEQGAAKALIDASGTILAMGVIRKCLDGGYKTGPLFAKNYDAAERVFLSLAATADGKDIYLDTPENNEGAVALARKHQMKGFFSCGRMYYRRQPDLPWKDIFGVTTFELG